MAVNASRDIPRPGMLPADIRTIGNEDLRWALKEGWDDFRAFRGDLLFLPLIYAAIGFLAAAIAFQRDLFPLIFPLAAGFALVGPIAAAGFYEMARRRETGDDPSWRHFLDPMAGRARFPLLFLSVLLAALFVAWVTIARSLYAGTLGTIAYEGIGGFFSALFATPEGWRMILVGNLVGAGFALVALVISAFSFPMVVDRAVDPFEAITTSIRAFAKNPATMLKWGFLVALILLLGSLPLFIGLMVALPVLGYATWHLYTRAIER